MRFGEKFSRDFVDSIEDNDSVQGLMNVHNNEAGRRVRRNYTKYIFFYFEVPTFSLHVKYCFVRLFRLFALVCKKFANATECQDRVACESVG